MDTVLRRWPLGALAVFLFMAPSAWGVPAFVQYASAGNGGSGNAAVAFSASNITTNDLIVVHCLWGNTTQTLSSVTDTAGNTYTLIANSSVTESTNMRTQSAYAIITAGSGTKPTITCTRSSTSNAAWIEVAEYSGTATSGVLDQSAGTSGTSATPTSPSVTTTASGELIVGLFTQDGGAGETWTGGSGYTLRSPSTGSNERALEDQVQSTAGSISANATMSSSQSWTAVIITFKASGGAPPCANSIALLGAGCR